MLQAARRELFEEFVALVLAAVIFVAGVAAARMQGSMLAGASGLTAYICTTESKQPDMPADTNRPHDHCTLCTFVVTDRGAASPPDMLRPFARSHLDLRTNRLVVRLQIRAFDARGPPIAI